MKNLALTVALLFVVLMAAGCYTQVGYYESRLDNQASYHRHSREMAAESKHEKQARLESETEKGVDHEDSDTNRVEVEEEEDEGYYGHRKPVYRKYTPYYTPYYHDYYYPQPYPYYSYGGYDSFYPYRPYRYSGYNRYYNRNYGRHHRYSGTRSNRTYKNRDVHHGKTRSRQYRGRSH